MTEPPIPGQPRVLPMLSSLLAAAPDAAQQIRLGALRAAGIPSILGTGSDRRIDETLQVARRLAAWVETGDIDEALYPGRLEDAAADDDPWAPVHTPDPALLAALLETIERIDPSTRGDVDAPDAQSRYDSRNRVVIAALGVAVELGYDCGLGVSTSPDDREYPVIAYIELPTGQVSWHLPAYPTPWDGHDGATKSARIAAYAAEADRG